VHHVRHRPEHDAEDPLRQRQPRTALRARRKAGQAMTATLDRAAHRRAVRNRMRVQLRRARVSAAIVAVGIVLAIVSTTLLVSQISGGIPVGGKRTLRVAVDDAKGVVPGKNEVRWAGVVVGRITKARLSGSRVVLTAELQPKYDRTLYRDARLRLRPQT